MSSAVVEPGVPTLVVEPCERAPGRARKFVAARFREWGITDDGDALVVVSEFVTNALVHGEGPIIVRVLRDERDGRPVVEVRDGGEGRPVMRPEDHEATSGRGLFMVSQLAAEWGTRPLPEGGKAAWAKL